MVRTASPAEATVYGLEVDLEAQPTDALFLRGSLGLMENEFDEWSDALGDYTGAVVVTEPASGSLCPVVATVRRLCRPPGDIESVWRAVGFVPLYPAL